MMRKLTQEEFETKAKLIHKNKYDKYGVYSGCRNVIPILCPIHGWFEQVAGGHLGGCGCQECKKDVLAQKKVYKVKRKPPTKMDFSVFVERSNKIHNGKYFYPTQKYINLHSIINIVCPSHGIFKQEMNVHMRGSGCKQCAIEKQIKTQSSNTKEFILKAQEIHNRLYDYSKVEYVNNESSVVIICKLHGEFIQLPSNHLSGYGCSECGKFKSKLEDDMADFLRNNDINFIQSFRDTWLGLQHLDFYLPDYNVAIECQGKQHFVDGCTFGGNETLGVTQKRDQLKLKKCKENGVKLLYYSNLGIDYPYHVFEDKEELIKEILNS